MAAISILGPSYRLTGKALSDSGAVLVLAARSLEVRLGTNVSTTNVPTMSARTGRRQHAEETWA